MTLPAFTWTARARPIIQIGIGDTRIDQAAAVWDVSRWDAADATWSGVEPIWQDVTCEAFSFRAEYGRARSTDRFVAGAATIVVWNATGWADPDPQADDPAVLTMRPGRAIRVGVLHTSLGTRWLFRGFIDSMSPIYDPTQPDTVELSCIDALGEVNRAKITPVDPPIGAGDFVDARLTRLLDAASWPTQKRAIAPSGDTLIADDMGGQLADLLGQAADSGGGNVYGDLDGNVAYRNRDWQLYVPGTPPDGSIGNVDMTGSPGEIIPGTPAKHGYLSCDGTANRWVSTYDQPDLVIDGDIRWTAFVRDDSAESTTSRVITSKADRGGARFDYRLGHTYTTATNVTGYPAGIASPQIIVGARTRAAIGQTPPGADVYVGARLSGVKPGGSTVTALQAQFLASTDGLTWTPVGTPSAAVRSDAVSFDGSDPLYHGLFWQGRIYWSQVEAINRARLILPGVTGNYLWTTRPAVTGDIEIVMRLSATDWTPPAVTTLVGSWNDVAANQRSFLVRLQANGTFVFNLSSDGVNNASGASTVAPVGWVDGQTYWVKITRVAATGITQFYWASDAPVEPTTWVKLGGDVTISPSLGLFSGGAPLQIGAFNWTSSTQPWSGRIARVIVRNVIGTRAAGLFDMTENNAGGLAAGATAFNPTIGGGIAVLQTGANQIVQPQLDRVVWRFDANDYPMTGGGTIYSDPRGRQWTLSVAGAIVPRVDAVPPIVIPPIPPDVCPVSWERPFARADLATRVIIGRDPETAQVLDDLDAQLLYGIEPFERTDLLTERDDTLTLLGNRVLRVRSAFAAPRIRSVTIDARTADTALDLMSSVDVYKPSRYRCRLKYPEPRGLVFDAEHIATGVVHEMTPSSWTLNLNLDLAAPYAAIGGQWDEARWDQGYWGEEGAA